MNWLGLLFMISCHWDWVTGNLPNATGFSNVTLCLGVSFSSACSETGSPPMTNVPVGNATNAIPMLLVIVSNSFGNLQINLISMIPCVQARWMQ